MTKGYLFFILATVGGAIFFYNSNALISLVCMGLALGALYGAGKIG